ncbi:hypothetical protein KR067_002257, partial [Drosophila pandora]
MLNPKSKASGDDSSTVAWQTDNRRVEASGAQHIGWSFDRRPDLQVSQDQVAAYLSEIHLSHKQITKRFVELLKLFEDYTKILETESGHHGVISFPMKRVLSEQLSRKEAVDQSEGKTSSSSLLQLSECTIKGSADNSQAVTCEVSSQTSWSALEQKQADVKELEAKLAQAGVGCGGGEGESFRVDIDKPSKVLQHTIHIEVESVTSATEMQRPPLRQRMWQVIVQTADTIMACAYMIGENFTYVLFIVLCLWCLYLLMGHYYSFLQTNVNQQID